MNNVAEKINLYEGILKYLRHSLPLLKNEIDEAIIKLGNSNSKPVEFQIIEFN